MEKLIEKFNEIRSKNPFTGDYPVLAIAIIEHKYRPSIISQAFDKLVSKDEYLRSEKDNLLEYLFSVSK